MIKFQTYKINNLVLSNQVLESYITQFWMDIFTPIKDTKHLMIMVKVQFTETELGYRTLGHLRRINFDDKDLFIEYLSERLGLLNESYVTHSISNITFSYITKSGLATDNRRLLQDLTNNINTTHRFNNLNLPISMNPEDYGTIILNNYVEVNGVSVNRFVVENGTRSYIIDISNEGLTNNVKILGAVDLSWIDTKLSEDIFKREIGKSSIFFMDKEIVLRKKQLNAKSFTKLSVEARLKSKFVTMDIETVNIQSKITPYLICAYNGSVKIHSYAQTNAGIINKNALFNSFMDQLLTLFGSERYMYVYAHNLSGFDGIFLMKHLLSYGKVEPILHNGKIMSIKLRLNRLGYLNKTIIFKDSMLLLPISLRDLCVSFNITVPKSYFPFKLTNIFYIGIFPKFEYWTGITFEEYNNLLSQYTGKIWNFKEEAIKYCYLDCVCLHQILVQFNELIFNKFKLNINNSLTFPALAMRIYKSQFMPENTIYQILGSIERDIRESYTGGAVDVFIPHNNSGEDGPVHIYDVNGLYPFIMSKLKMPVGKPIVF